jgi:hypothetical protein
MLSNDVGRSHMHALVSLDMRSVASHISADSCNRAGSSLMMQALMKLRSGSFKENA